VVSHQQIVTETMPFILRTKGLHELNFEALKNKPSKSLDHHRYTLEFSGNPFWYVVQALPYLDEANQAQAEQVFHQLFANSIAAKIVQEKPEIQSIVQQWKKQNPETLKSKLVKNQELKQLLIEETPWLESAFSESEQKQQIVQLFDENSMQHQFQQGLNRLGELQLENGGWSWIEGMPDSRYVTQLILIGLGQLNKIGVLNTDDKLVSEMVQRALAYADRIAEEDYQKLINRKVDLDKDHLGRFQVQYLYLRSLFPFYQSQNKAYSYYLRQAESYWQNKSLMEQGMQALALHRLSPESKAKYQILVSIKEHAIVDPQLGMYWKNYGPSYLWQHAKIETQALLIEAFLEIGQELDAIEELQLWLINQKRVQHWGGHQATARACYALLMKGNEKLLSEKEFQIRVGNEIIDKPFSPGLAYLKRTWTKNSIKENMHTIEIRKSTDNLSWGGIYWQYFEDLDKISSSSSGELSISKTIFKEIYTPEGKKLVPIDSSPLNVGDKAIVRLRIENKLNLEFVHLNDQHAACMEPMSMISGYRVQDGLAYYQSTKDASTNFYFEKLPKGVYVLEFPLRLSQIGVFKSGISKLQSYYAPEFNTHSSGELIKVLKR
jgi:hypothetical protein